VFPGSAAATPPSSGSTAALRTCGRPSGPAEDGAERPPRGRGRPQRWRAPIRARALDRKIAESPCVRIALPALGSSGHVAVGTDQRISEILVLTWDRIDLEANTITVDRQMTAERRLGPPKTASPTARWSLTRCGNTARLRHLPQSQKQRAEQPKHGAMTGRGHTRSATWVTVPLTCAYTPASSNHTSG
jgi:hypothetical protein